MFLALFDSFVFNSIFSVFSVGIWFSLQFTRKVQRNWTERLSYFLAAIAFILLITIGSSILIMRAIGSDDMVYLAFLERSLTMRIIASVLIYLLLLSAFSLYQSINELRERIQREASLTEMLREAELNQLRAQINPHFLFNSLNSVSSLTIIDPSKAQEMVIKLSEFMRYSLSMADESLTTLGNELHHTGLYLDIEKVRFSDRLLIEKQVDGICNDWPIPAMILQPLLENAVKHGVYSTTGISVVNLEIKCDNDYLLVGISNAYDPDSLPRKGTGTGLKNVSGRMKAIYRRNDLFSVKQTDHTFSVYLRFPLIIPS